MSEKRKKYDREFREGAVRIVRETGKSIAAVARDLGIRGGALGNWVAQDREVREGRAELTRDDPEELKRLRSEVADLRDLGWEVSEKSVADSMRRQGLVAAKRSGGMRSPSGSYSIPTAVAPIPQTRSPSCAGSWGFGSRWAGSDRAC
jgi:transposase